MATNVKWIKKVKELNGQDTIAHRNQRFAQPLNLGDATVKPAVKISGSDWRDFG